MDRALTLSLGKVQLVTVRLTIDWFKHIKRKTKKGGGKEAKGNHSQKTFPAEKNSLSKQNHSNKYKSTSAMYLV